MSGALSLASAGAVLLAVSGVPAWVAGPRRGGAPGTATSPSPAELASAALAVAASVLLLAGAVSTLLSGGDARAAFAWRLPLAALALRLDALAAAFLVPIAVLSGAAAVYGLGYWPARDQETAGRVRLFLGLLGAGMAGVVLAAHAVAFLVAWETMALAAFFLVATEHAVPEVHEAAWTYLVATHVGTMALLALFTLMRARTGSFALGPIEASSALFLLALLGFGFKAGLVPLHFWLPGAHANAPSHVSALLSGAMLKVGIYGLFRFLTLVAAPPAWWGALLVALGLGGALVAVVLALGETDLKRALAYSSVENVGIVAAGLGLWVLGRAHGDARLAALGAAAALAHVFAHALFKGLLFLSAGSVLHATGTRRVSALGGLLKRMPATGIAFLAGAAAAAALPGANAFASELLLYAGLLATVPSGSVISLGAAVLGVTGALALACFVRLAGIAFLGEARSDAAASAHEASAWMRAPMAVLAALCLVFGLFPEILVRPLAAVAGDVSGVDALFRAIQTPLRAVIALAAVLGAWLAVALRRSPRAATWGCGYAAPTARMQYTAGSLSELVSTRLAPGFLGPVAERSRGVRGLFPPSAAFATRTREPFADLWIRPALGRWAARLVRLRRLQQGRLTAYLVYILVALLLGLAWSYAEPLLARLTPRGLP